MSYIKHKSLLLQSPVIVHYYKMIASIRFRRIKSHKVNLGYMQMYLAGIFFYGYSDFQYLLFIRVAQRVSLSSGCAGSVVCLGLCA